MERKIYLIKRSQRILLDDPNPSSRQLDIEQLKTKYPLLEESICENPDLYIYEFTPYSEISYDKLYILIFSEKFGEISLCSNFLEHLKGFPPVLKIISILNHAIILNHDRLIYNEAKKITFREVNKYFNEESFSVPENPKSLYNLYLDCSSDDIINLHDKCISFGDIYFSQLGVELSSEMQNLFEFYNLKNYKNYIDNKETIINQDNELLIISPLIYDWNQWCKIVLYEFSILENSQKRIALKKKIIASIHQLENRIGYKNIPDLPNDRFYDNGNTFFVTSHIDKTDFKVPLLKYISYIDDHKIDDILPNSNSQLISKLSDKINRKIILNKSPIKLNLLLLKFFRLNEVSIDEDSENRIKRFIKNCFEINPKFPFESKSNETINFLDSALRDKLCKFLYVLNEEKILKYKSSRHLYLILIKDLKDHNNENIGLSESTLKPLFSELNDKKNYTHNIIKEVGFESLTSLRSILSN